jgi:hypothetical protein
VAQHQERRLLATAISTGTPTHALLGIDNFVLIDTYLPDIAWRVPPFVMSRLFCSVHVERLDSP